MKKRRVAKKRSPTEIIEDDEYPNLEVLYVRPRGSEFQYASGTRKEGAVSPDKEKINQLTKDEPYAMLHTHPVSEKNFIEEPPSVRDLRAFLKNPKQRTDIIAQRDAVSGKVEGYYVLRKSKNTPVVLDPLLADDPHHPMPEAEYRKLEKEQEKFWQRIKDSGYYTKGENYDSLTESEMSKRIDALSNFLKQYDIRIKFVPTKGYTYIKGRGFVKRVSQQSGLQKKIAAMVASAGLIGGVFFLSSNATGNAIGSLGQTSSNWIGGVLFLIGLIGALVYLRKNKKTSSSKTL